MNSTLVHFFISYLLTCSLFVKNVAQQLKFILVRQIRKHFGFICVKKEQKEVQVNNYTAKISTQQFV